VPERTKIVFVGGESLTVDGALGDVSRALSAASRIPDGWNELSGPDGEKMLVNREHVIYVVGAPEDAGSQ
jgi:hypothetical protein